MKPAPSVLSPASSPPKLVTVLTTPRRSATGLRRWHASAAPALCGMVTDKPLIPRSTMAATAARARPEGTGKAT